MATPIDPTHKPWGLLDLEFIAGASFVAAILFGTIGVIWRTFADGFMLNFVTLFMVGIVVMLAIIVFGLVVLPTLMVELRKRGIGVGSPPNS